MLTRRNKIPLGAERRKKRMKRVRMRMMTSLVNWNS
jgi:hypothetical protein